MLSYQAPKRRDIRSLQNWVENSANLATDETAYLSKTDLLCVGTTNDDPLVQVEILLEKVVRFCYGIFRKVGRSAFQNRKFVLSLIYAFKRPQIDLSRDPNVFIFSSSLLKRITRGLIA